jgi:coproporphyrinogen III oxidase-like Fe-S oxidoreductase
MKRRNGFGFGQRNPNAQKRISKRHNRDYLFWRRNASVLTSDEINFLIDSVYENYEVDENPEITLEANPDDLSGERILELSKVKSTLALGFNLL